MGITNSRVYRAWVQGPDRSVIKCGNCPATGPHQNMIRTWRPPFNWHDPLTYEADQELMRAFKSGPEAVDALNKQIESLYLAKKKSMMKSI